MKEQIQKLNSSLKEIGRMLSQYPSNLQKKISEENYHQEKRISQERILEQLQNVFQEAEQQGIYWPYLEICQTLDLDFYEKLLICLLLFVAQESNSQISYPDVKEILSPFEKYHQGTSLSVCFWHEKQQLFLSPVSFAFLIGQFPLWSREITLELPQQEICYGRQEILKTGSLLFHHKEFLEKEPCAIVLEGKTGSGRHFLAQQLAAQEGYALITVKENIGGMEARQKNDLFLSLQLYQALLCIEIPRDNNVSFLKEFSAYVPFVILLLEEGQKLQRHTGYTHLYQFLEDPDETLKKEIFQKIFEEEELYKKSPEILSIQKNKEIICSQKMPLGSYIRYLKEIRLSTFLGNFQWKKYVYQPDDRYLTPLSGKTSLSQLKLPPKQLQRLERICHIAGARKEVQKQWGFGKKYAYGNGITMLFYGAPGTGKTMAAQVMANLLEMPLFRVDLSQLTSKYIGETQKNISRVFEEAEKCECILLFDEADAIFAKRSEVTDAQDKYSNAETAYLLQRFEQYQGICILATNFLKNFDEAFLRRITYMLHFPMPDETIRKELWENVLPKEAKISDDLDFSLLAHTFELSGSAIKNAAYHGACCACWEKTEIGMGHLLEGIWNEYTKIGKTLGQEQKALMMAYEVIGI